MALFGLTEKIRAAWKWNELGVKASRAEDAVKKELDMEAENPTYEFKKTLLKGAKGLALVALTLAAASVATSFADSTFVDGKLEAAGLSHQVSMALASIIAFGAESLRNWLKNRDKAA